MARAVSLLMLLLALLAFPNSGVCGYPWPDNVTQYRGYVEVNQTYGVNLFYWFFESRSNPATDPLVVWLTGGPGCSSELGMLLENGPFLILGSDVPVYNPNGWNSFANVLYIDNPGGTGFSYVKNSQGYVTDERTIANELWDLIRTFYGMYPKYANLNLYITGESYAGHYVPALGQVIVESNSPFAKNLQGLAIGNGWVDPLIQYQSYAQFALQNSLITEAQFNQAQQLYGPCQAALNNGDWNTAYQRCSSLEGFILETAQRNLGRSINPYDIRQTCPGGGLCYDITNITKFLNRADVQADLGVSRTWEACDPTVLDHLIDDWVQNFANATATVLLHKKTVVVYSGMTGHATYVHEILFHASGPPGTAEPSLTVVDIDQSFLYLMVMSDGVYKSIEAAVDEAKTIGANQVLANMVHTYAQTPGVGFSSIAQSTLDQVAHLHEEAFQRSAQQDTSPCSQISVIRGEGQRPH